MSRKTLRIAALAAMAAISLSPALPAAAGDDFGVGEAAGENLFSKADKGDAALRQKAFSKVSKGSANVLNLRLCADPNLNAALTAGGKPCRPFVRDFTAEGLAAAGQEDLRPIFASLDKKLLEANGKIPSLFLAKAQAEARALSQDRWAELEESAADLRTYAQAGLYADGDLDNSDYDLVTDLEAISKAVFNQPAKYSGPTNVSAGGAGRDFWSGRGEGGWNSETDAGTVSADGKISEEKSLSGFAYKDATAAACDSPAFGKSLVSEVNALLDPQYGESEDDGGDYAGDPVSGAGLSNSVKLATPKARGNCANDAFFCIDIQFLKYTRSLLGWGSKKAATVEAVVDKHLAHAEAQAGKSFAQNRHATNSFQAGFSGNLKGMLLNNLSFKPEVNFVPAPFLKSKGIAQKKKGTGGEDFSTSGLVAQEMACQGLGKDPERWNALYLNEADLNERKEVARLDAGGNVDQASEYATENEMRARTVSYAACAAPVAESYAADASGDELASVVGEAAGFASSFRETASKLVTIVQSMGAKSQ